MATRSARLSRSGDGHACTRGNVGAGHRGAVEQLHYQPPETIALGELGLGAGRVLLHGRLVDHLVEVRLRRRD
eukprot:3802369-Prymnesium_polylepis.1